jgi:hypothetical protein
MEKWEYRTIKTEGVDLDQTLEETLPLLGEQGWELVNVITSVWGGALSQPGMVTRWGAAACRLGLKRHKQ